jgi:hypothetical protein
MAVFGRFQVGLAACGHYVCFCRHPPPALSWVGFGFGVPAEENAFADPKNELGGGEWAVFCMPASPKPFVGSLEGASEDALRATATGRLMHVKCIHELYPLSE